MTPDTQTPPGLMPFNPDGIPQSLKDTARWAPWVAVWSPKRNKYDKIPRRVDSPQHGISTAKPDQWYTFKAALNCYQKNPGVFAGLGYVMTGETTLIATDLDHCIEANTVAPWAQEIVDALASYTEISPSGTGIRIFSAGTHPDDFQNHDQGIEVYSGNDPRFLTVSGQHVPGTSASVTQAPQGVVQSIQTRYAKERTKATVIDLNLPELIDPLALPDLEDLNIPHQTRNFLTQGDTIGDRSKYLHQAGIDLYRAGLDDAQVFSTICASTHAIDVAMDHRGQDLDRAMLYIWREQCLKAKPKAQERMLVAPDAFDDVSEPAAPKQAPIVQLTGLPRKRFAFTHISEFLDRPASRWLIKGVLPHAEVGAVYGSSTAGKSFLTLDMAMAVARGCEWRGHRVQQGSVAYVVAEGAGGFPRRVKAYCDHHGVDDKALPFSLLAAAPSLLDGTQVKELISALKDIKGLTLVVLDTLAQVTAGADENSGEEMGTAMRHAALIAKATGAMVLLVAHSGKDSAKGLRGWSGIHAALDVVIGVQRDQAGERRSAVIAKIKDGDTENREYLFRLNTVRMGVDDDGDAITSCTVEEVAGAPAGPRAVRTEPTGAVQKTVLSVARRLAEIDGDTTQDALAAAAANELVYVTALGKRDNRLRDATRAIQNMATLGLLTVTNGVVYVTNP